ncbi:Outer membrane lipid asymmetry maintenance protein MlaD (fragment) [uncultured Defluviicoccus sp.]|uniref:Outer membrane lipid asymmetry maintenance protein MlaD n=1 Tax=metagenome TaxID=256318 RepID=A0A380TK07_9ZZZZ
MRISGIKVGVVTARSLDPVSFNATIKMTIAETIKLPEDTVAVISSEGLVGEKYVRLEPGRSTTLIPANGKIRETRNFRSLEDQVGEIIFLATNRPGAAAPPDM